MKKLLLILLLLLPVAARAQTSGVSYRWRGGLAAARPVTCRATAPVDIYYATNTDVLYICTTTNTWTIGFTAGSSGGGISGLTTNTVPKATSATTVGNSRITDDGTHLFLGTESGSVNEYLEFSVSPSKVAKLQSEEIQIGDYDQLVGKAFIILTNNTLNQGTVKIQNNTSNSFFYVDNAAAYVGDAAGDGNSTKIVVTDTAQTIAQSASTESITLDGVAHTVKLTASTLAGITANNVPIVTTTDAQTLTNKTATGFIFDNTSQPSDYYVTSLPGTCVTGKTYLRFAAAVYTSWICTASNTFVQRYMATDVASIAAGGTGTGSTLVGLVRGNATAMTAAELSGDATTSGSNAVTVVKVNGNTPGGTCTNQFARSLSSSAVPTCATVALSSDVSGTLAAAQFPALTGDVTNSAGALATTLATVNGNVGSFGSATTSLTATVNAKGLITAISSQTVTPAESSLTFTDITTNNSSTSKHGFLLKLDNNAAHYMDGTGAWTTPAGGGGGASAALDNLASVSINTSLLAQTGVDLGSTTKPFRDAYLFGGGTFATTYLKLTGTPTGTRTVTFPDATITVASINVAQTITAAQTNSTAGASVTPAMLYSGTPITGVSATNNYPLVYLNGGTAPTTWNNTASGGTYLGVNGISGFAGNFLDFHVNGAASVFAVSSAGTITSAGNLNAFAYNVGSVVRMNGTGGTGTLLLSSTAPTVTGFGTSPSVPSNNGTGAFTVNVGTGGSASTGTVTLPTAATGWVCSAFDVTNPDTAVTNQTGGTTTTATFTNYSRTTGIATAWAASDILRMSCHAY